MSTARTKASEISQEQEVQYQDDSVSYLEKSGWESPLPPGSFDEGTLGELAS